MLDFSNWLCESLVESKMNLVREVVSTVLKDKKDTNLSLVLGFANEDEMWKFARNDIRSPHLIWGMGKEIPKNNKYVDNYKGN